MHCVRSSIMSFKKSDVVTEVVSAPPLFFLSKEAPDDISHVEICEATEAITGFDSCVGCQRLGAVWRVYPANRLIRAQLAGQQISIRGRKVSLTLQSPFSFIGPDGQEIPSTRLTVDGLPVSVSSADIEGYIRKAGANLRSPVMWEKARTRQGQLSRWITGRRYLFIDLPTVPLPHRISVGSFSASLFYREQHRKTFACFECGEEGHRRGDPSCKGKSTGQVGAVSGAVNGEVVREEEVVESAGEVVERDSEVEKETGDEEEEKVERDDEEEEVERDEEEAEMERDEEGEGVRKDKEEEGQEKVEVVRVRGMSSPKGKKKKKKKKKASPMPGQKSIENVGEVSERESETERDTGDEEVERDEEGDEVERDDEGRIGSNVSPNKIKFQQTRQTTLPFSSNKRAVPPSPDEQFVQATQRFRRDGNSKPT